jgi:hypothetical protein
MRNAAVYDGGPGFCTEHGISVLGPCHNPEQTVGLILACLNMSKPLGINDGQ